MPTTPTLKTPAEPSVNNPPSLHKIQAGVTLPGTPPVPAAGGGRTKLRAAHLDFFYGKRQALFDINIDVPADQLTAFIGPSGCGKSTFLRTFNRMYENVRHSRAEGDILLGGEDVRAMELVALRRRVGMVFQKPNPFPKSIFDNVAFGLRINGLAHGREVAERVENNLRRAALWEEVKDKLKESAFSLSGGQQQRLCIARALSAEPEVMLLDEPCSALDPIATAKIEDLLFHLKTECTMVIVTHNMQQAARIADFTGFFLMGKLIEFDATSSMFRTPSKKETEDYITGRFG